MAPQALPTHYTRSLDRVSNGQSPQIMALESYRKQTFRHHPHSTSTGADQRRSYFGAYRFFDSAGLRPPFCQTIDKLQSLGTLEVITCVPSGLLKIMCSSNELLIR